MDNQIHIKDFGKNRIEASEYKKFIEVFSRIDTLLKVKKTISIAIDGNCAAGKSTLSKLIGDVYNCNIFHMDHFFLRKEQKTEKRLNEVGGNVDYERFKEEVLEALLIEDSFSYRIYDCKLQNFGQKIDVIPKPLNIIEGSYSMHSSLIKYYDLKVFLGIGAKEQSNRILKRNGPIMHKKFIDEWIPLENEYFNKMKIQELSDLIYKNY